MAAELPTDDRRHRYGPKPQVVPDGLREEIAVTYRQGASVLGLERQFGLSDAVITRILREEGVRLRTKIEQAAIQGAHNRVHLDVGSVARRYTDGESIQSLANSLGVSRPVVTRRLREAGIPIRGYKESSALVQATRTPEFHQRNTEAAHAAARGRVRSHDEACRMALGRQRAAETHGTRISRYERLMRDWLAERGMPTVPQLAVGPYNCDLAAYPVAVEVFGGNWHFTGNHAKTAPDRFRYFLDRGWLVIVVWVHPTRHPIGEGAADQVVALRDAAQRNPSMLGQYRVIRGAGRLVPVNGRDVDDLTRVPTFERRLDPGA